MYTSPLAILFFPALSYLALSNLTPPLDAYYRVALLAVYFILL